MKSQNLIRILLAVTIMAGLSGCQVMGPTSNTDDTWKSSYLGGYFDSKEEMEAYIRSTQTASLNEFTPISGNYQTIRVRFATDRKLIPDKSRNLFGSEPGTMSYGTCYVSIPVNHKIGVLESPTLWKAELKPNPEKHIVLLRTQLESSDIFYSTIANDIQFTTDRSALVFVHGYNVTFADAARRTAQMAADLQFQGVSAFFSWPSRAHIPSYTVDERNIEWAEPDIKGFLRDFITKSKAENVYVIAHSMGTRALTRALNSLAVEQPEINTRIKGIILAAPDIDAEIFKRDIAPKLIAPGRSVTLYASSNDKALKTSKFIHGYPRAGESGKGLVIINGMDTIDASSVDTSLFGHSYFSDTRTIISDIHYLIRDYISPDGRSGLKSIGSPPNRHWLIKP